MPRYFWYFPSVSSHPSHLIRWLISQIRLVDWIQHNALVLRCSVGTIDQTPIAKNLPLGFSAWLSLSEAHPSERALHCEPQYIDELATREMRFVVYVRLPSASLPASRARHWMWKAFALKAPKML